MKKVIVILLCALLAASVFTGCTKVTSATSSTTTMQGTQPTQKNAADYKGKVTFSLDSGFVGEGGFEETFRKPFNEIYPNIEIETIAVSPDERYEKLVIMLASDTGPDVVQMEESYYTSLVPSGHMYPLDDLVAADPDFDYSMFNSNGVAFYKQYDGIAYSIPVSPYNKVLLFNKKTFDKYGVEYPYYGMTMEDLLEKARQLNEKIKAAGDDKQDMRPFCQWEILIEPLTDAMEIGFYDAKTAESNFDDPKVQKAVKFWADLWNENLMITQDEARAKGYGDTYKLFVTKQYPMIIEHSWILDVTQNKEISDNPFEGVYDCIPVPPFEGEEQVQPPVTFLGIGMTKDVKDPETAFQVLKFGATKWYDNMIVANGVYAATCYNESQANKTLTSDDFFPGYKYIIETTSAIKPEIITEVHDEIIWIAIRDVTSEAAIAKTSYEKVITQIEEAVNAVLERHKSS